MTIKRILYAGVNSLGVSVYDGRAFLGEVSFGADETGQAEFREYLRQEPDIVTSLIVDMIEEEYRNETIPHLFGRDRHAVVVRKLEQTFRATPYRAAQVQGRAAEGRRDDRVLFTALTNPDVLAAYLAPLEEYQVPLAGIYSAPMLATFLLRRLGVKADNVLLLTRNRQGSLRQTFVHRNELKNSRLSPPGASENGAALLAQEIEKNRRYLNRLRLLAQDAALDAVIVGEQEFIGQLRAAWRGTESLRYHLITLDEAAAAVGLADGSSVPDSERLFVHLLYRFTPSINYAQAANRRGYVHYRIRNAMLAASLGLLLGGVAWAGANVMDGLALDRQSAAALRGIESLRADYEAAVAGQPQMDVDVEQMRWIVDAGESIRQFNSTPWTMLQAISAGVSVHPAIRVDGVDWDSTHQDGEVNPEDLALSAPQGTGAGVAERAIIKGRVESPGGNLRAAFNQVDAFMETLRQQGRFSQVRAVTMPLNVDPDDTVAGIVSAQPDVGAATFEIEVVLRSGA